jgi:hypothetical protein
MLDFKITKTLDSEAVNYEVFGYIDEKASFPYIDLKPKIIINLKDVKGINSVGTRSWCMWVKQMTSPTLVFLEECPMLFVKSFNQVLGSLTMNMTVNSFVVPYYSEDSDERKLVVFRLGTEFNSAGQIKFPVVLDSKGKAMEPDVLDQYFSFLKK